MMDHAPKPGGATMTRIARVTLLASALASSSALAAATVDQLSQTDPATWLLKSVCVAGSGQLLAVDPYGGCPVGATLRKIQPGDPMPYNNYEQMGYQISDSFQVLAADGSPLSLHNFDYAPFNQFNLHSGSDGFDVYAFTQGNASVSNTRDGGGYGTTFFGANCSFGNGWVLFPQVNFSVPGSGSFPISGVYWEHNQQSSPGGCPADYSTNTLTSWQLDPAHAFGGVNGHATRSMQALTSFHGFETNDGVTPTANFLQNGHLEVFYYTREYGLTRWEVWVPPQQNPQGGNKAECNGSAVANYRGQPFTIQFCHDWSNVVPLTRALLPTVPLPSANLLQHGHFEGGFSDGGGAGLWHRFGQSQAGRSINWSSLVATSGSDGLSGTGMRYLATNCGAANGSGCGPGGTQAIYQDIPASRFCSGCGVLYGADARSESGSGTLQAAIQVLDGNGTVLWQNVSSATLQPDNGDGRPGEAASVYRSSAFVGNQVTLPSMAGAAWVRFLILPLSPNTFDVVDAFVDPYPTLQRGLQL
jgi:hypothetical protein